MRQSSSGYVFSAKVTFACKLFPDRTRVFAAEKDHVTQSQFSCSRTDVAELRTREHLACSLPALPRSVAAKTATSPSGSGFFFGIKDAPRCNEAAPKRQSVRHICLRDSRCPASAVSGLPSLTTRLLTTSATKPNITLPIRRKKTLPPQRYVFIPEITHKRKHATSRNSSSSSEQDERGSRPVRTLFNIENRVKEPFSLALTENTLKENVMKTKLAFPLAVLALVAVALFSPSNTSTTSAQTARTAQPGTITAQPGTITAPDVEALKLNLPSPTLSATCFCKVIANGIEVAKPTKGGYVQPLQAGKCQDYCKGLWDAPGSPSAIWAHLVPNACGNVTVKMDAALGTMAYTTVRGPKVEPGINGTHFVTTCSCPTGQTASNVIQGQKYCLIGPSLANVPGIPDQVSGGGAYVWNNSNFYQSSGAQKCVTACQ